MGATGAKKRASRAKAVELVDTADVPEDTPVEAAELAEQSL
jgi:hypothetical protein